MTKMKFATGAPLPVVNQLWRRDCGYSNVQGHCLAVQTVHCSPLMTYTIMAFLFSTMTRPSPDDGRNSASFR